VNSAPEIVNLVAFEKNPDDDVDGSNACHKVSFYISDGFCTMAVPGDHCAGA
jgi:hypothetical protein